MRSNRLFVWNACALSVLTVLAGEAVGQSRVAVEKIMREIAVRELADPDCETHASYWPSCPTHGDSPGPMPRNGWYDEELTEEQMASLVGSCYGKFFGASVYAGFLVPDSRSLAGRDIDQPGLTTYFRNQDGQGGWDTNLPW